MVRKLLYSLLVIFYSCGMSTEELQKEVKASIIEELKEDPKYEGVEVIDLSLIHKEGNEYVGILNVLEPNTFAETWNTLLQVDALNEEGINTKYDVKVIYDGSSFMWEIESE